MSFIRHADDFLIHELTYWSRLANDGFGNQVVSEPELHRCRWREGSEKVLDATGEEFVSKAKIHTICDLAVGGFVAKGDFVCFDDETDPTQPVADPQDLGAAVRFVIRQKKKTESIDGDDSLYVYWI